MSKILVTGAAGFIGFHLSQVLLSDGHDVVGYDNLNDYYDVKLKEDRLAQLSSSSKFSFVKADLEDKVKMDAVFKEHGIEFVVNLAAQAGVRYSIENPDAYVQANLVGFINILECCRHHKIKHLVYASSSSVYGANKKLPFSEDDAVDHPVSLYAATKKANELMAHCYSNLYDLPTTGLRFFTVYGPWGRPDMALFLFTKAISEGKPIDVFNHGKMIRDFTYVADIVEGVKRLLFKIAEPEKDYDAVNPRPSVSNVPYRIFNIGNQNPVQLMDFIKEIEKNLGKKAKMNMMDIQDGDVPATQSDTSSLKDWVDYVPQVKTEEGIKNFVGWYNSYYK